MKSWLRNRFFIVGALLLAAIAGWNFYTSAHAHGIVTGAVVDAAGKPVEGAVIRMDQRDFVSQQERAHTASDAEGRFRFATNTSHLVQLEAEKAGVHSTRATIRLWFRAQDAALATPLRLAPTP